MFWMHAPLFAILALVDAASDVDSILTPADMHSVLILTQLYLTADVVDLYKDVGGTGAHQRLNYALFCSIWSFLFIVFHWAAPFIVAFGWSVVTFGFWVIAACVTSAPHI